MCEFLERRALPLAELRRPAPPRDDSHALMDALGFVDAPMLVTAHPAQLQILQTVSPGRRLSNLGESIAIARRETSGP